MITAVLGLVIGVAAILVGNALEGGHLDSLIQPTAALIVCGGTLGATMLGSSSAAFSGAIRAIPKIYMSREPDFKAIIEQIINLATIARKDGILALEAEIPKLEDPFLANNLKRIVDGFDPGVLETMMEEAITKEEHEKTAAVKVYDTAGGFAPTIGIIGAVLGLIHVMSNLSDSSKLGTGIAVAFVATVYGVSLANLIVLPMGGRLKHLTKVEIEAMEVMMVGILGIQSGLNPRVIEARIRGLAGHEGGEGEEQQAA